MSIFFPRDAGEAVRFWWLGAPLLFAPLIAPLVTWWKVYLTVEAMIAVLPFVIVFGPVVAWFMYKRSVWLVKAGLHAHFSPAEQFPLKNIAAAFLFIGVVVYCWALTVLAAMVIPTTATEERPFKISEVEYCTQKCLGCVTRVKFSDWVGMPGAQICADTIEPAPRSGDTLIVRGRFNVLVQYVKAVERPHG